MALAALVIAGDEPIELDAIGDRVGLVRGEERVERLDDVRLGQQVGERLGVGGVGVDLRDLAAPKDIRLDASTTGLPATASRISVATDSALVNGMARTTTSAAAAARRSRWRRRAPVAAATAPASLRIARGDDRRHDRRG